MSGPRAGRNHTTASLLDGASGTGTAISRESQELSRITRDREESLPSRVTAYEDIINLEVGDTSLARARNVEREAGFRQIYLKFEGGNPTGTHKDRIAFAQCLDALRRGFETVTVATCGNYGASVALAAYLAGLESVICIPDTYHTERIRDMTQSGGTIQRVPGSYEEAVEYSQNLAREKEYYDANPGGANMVLQLLAYGELAFEIYDTLRDAPKMVAVPVSNGTLLAGIYRGFQSLYKRGKTSRLPRMIAASSTNKNPIVRSFTRGFDRCVDLDPGLIRETRVNEPLINWHSFDGEEALEAIRSSHGDARWASDSKLTYISRLLRHKEGLSVLPASTAGVVALLELHRQTPLEGDRYVAVLTGRR